MWPVGKEGREDEGKEGKSETTRAFLKGRELGFSLFLFVFILLLNLFLLIPGSGLELAM